MERAIPAGLLAALLVLCGCSDPSASERALGPEAPSASVREVVSPNGRRLEVPEWLDQAPEKLERALRELDAAVEAFSASLHRNVEPDTVEIYPFGFQAFPVDRGLAAGFTQGGRVIIAWYRDPPHLRALGHELCHVARPDLSHAEIDADDRLTAARDAARAAQAAVRVGN